MWYSYSSNTDEIALLYFGVWMHFFRGHRAVISRADRNIGNANFQYDRMRRMRRQEIVGAGELKLK